MVAPRLVAPPAAAEPLIASRLGAPPLAATGTVRRSAALSWNVRQAFGALLSAVDDPDAHDLLIQVSAGRGELWVDRAGCLTRVPGWAESPEQVRALAVALIAAGGRHVDELHPCADVHVGGGIRVHAVLPPVCTSGAAISVRLPRVAPPGFDRLVADGLCTGRIAERLRTAITGRNNVLITGGTGTGKTTLLAALLGLVDPDQRIVTIEDLAELAPQHPHCVALETRQANLEGAGALGLDELLREALRMRPDRIVLGECRGAEIATLLTALNTGHDGGAGTLHASRLDDVAARLEALGALAGLMPAALARQVVAALHLIVHLERRGGSYRIAALGRPVLVGDRLAIEGIDGIEGIERLERMERTERFELEA